MLFATLNTFGKLTPDFATEKCSDTCRLPYCCALLKTASIDCLALPECTLSKSAAASVKRFVTSHVKGATAATSPVSSISATVLECYTDIIDNASQPCTKKGGVTILLGPRLAPFLLTPPRPFSAGRGLLLELTLPGNFRRRFHS